MSHPLRIHRGCHRDSGSEIANGSCSRDGVGTITSGMPLPAAAEARLNALRDAPRERWIALSADETRIVATGTTFEEVAAEAHRAGESDPLIMFVPEDWSPRIL